MREIQYSAKSNGNSGSESEDGLDSETSGWEVENVVEHEKEFQKLNGNLIDYVNKKIKLKDLLNKSGLHFEQKYSPSGWTHVRACPFPDHRDKTPSFYYNSQEDRFYCHGCNRGGRSVQFVAYSNNISIVAASERLIQTLGSLEDVYVDIQNEKQEKIDKALLDFSNTIRGFIQKNKSYTAVEFAERVTWGLDLYLTKHVSRSSIDEENLLARISLLKEKINSYPG